MNLKLLAAGVIGATLALSGCVTSETKPIPKIQAKQAVVHIPEAELLDVGIRVFDPGIPENIKDDEEALAKKRIYPDLRRAEARYIPTLLRETLESTAQWGAVRVIPESAEFVDVIVTGQLIDSNGGFLSVDITVTDSTASGLVAGVVRGLQRILGGGADRTTVHWERAWRPEGDRAVEYVSLELARPAPGTYVVAVTVRDRTSGRTATAERRFRVGG